MLRILTPLLLGSATAFAPSKLAVTRPAFSLRAFTDADGLAAKLLDVPLTASPPPPPPPAPVAAVVEEVPKIVEKAVTVSEPVVTSMPEVSIPAVSLPEVSMPDIGGLDLPIPIIAGVAVAAIAAALLLGGGGGEDSAAPASSSPKPAPAPASVDISVPYDAAAMLEYEKAGKPGDFESFKAKYLKDAVAQVIAKRKARGS